jgi:hypothetical protein
MPDFHIFPILSDYVLSDSVIPYATPPPPRIAVICPLHRGQNLPHTAVICPLHNGQKLTFPASTLFTCAVIEGNIASVTAKLTKTAPIQTEITLATSTTAIIPLSGNGKDG